MKSVLWRVTKRLSHIEDARCLKVNKLLYSSAVALQKGLVYENAPFQAYVNRRVFIYIKMLAVFQRL